MKLLIISSSNPYIAAGKVPVFIKHELQKNGHEVKLLTKFYDDFPEDGIVSYYNNRDTRFKNFIRKFKNRIKRLLPSFIRKVEKYHVQTFIQVIPLLRSRKVLRLTEFTPDVILMFFMQGFINYIDLYHVQKKANATVFILSPDMAPFTGLCHYSYDCIEYQKSCGKCPAINSTYKHDLSWFNLKSKIKYADKMDVIGVYWADEIGESMRKSAIFRNKNVVKVKLPLELEPSYYKPDKLEIKELRQRFDIGLDDFVVSASAVSLSNERKGIKDVIEAINLLGELNNRRIVLVVAGKGNLPITPNVKTINLGFISKEELAILFKISDIFVSASYADVGPETIPLSLSCGVPVISYKTGFANELIIHEYNGFLIDVNDINGIKDKIQYYLNIDNNIVQKFKLNAMNSAVNYYSNTDENSLETIIAKCKRPKTKI
ncbi:MAG: glycosyltransferase [Melioribacteraceae bacterium]|nr:glycosyltransferase [Bacteroidales bacterium]MCF8298707.1 glycosyltransferase [Saprospiraceae bacterium]MCF8395951.1 glycosyltransferase [Melioribacteraceae bacterium]